MLGNLHHKVALVTGGGSGLGREIASAFGAEGAYLAVADIVMARASEVASEIRELGARAVAVSVDTTNYQQVRRMVSRVIAEYGRIDILVNCAGLAVTFSPAVAESLQSWQNMFNVNLFGVFRCIKAVAPLMMAQQAGSIINISSWTGQPKSRPSRFGAYAVAKHGIEGLTDVLAGELEPYHVRVNALYPGSPCWTRAMESKLLDASGKIPPEKLQTLAEFPHGPIMRPDVVRPLAVFLASDDAASTTGESLMCTEWNSEHGFGDAAAYYWSPDKYI